MKKTIKEFINRLRDAWSIIRGHNYVFIRYDEDTSEQEMFRMISAVFGAHWLRNDDNVNYFSRANVLFDLLDDTNSVMLLTKEADGTLTYCYDCKSEEDFNDLISMEVE
jgi:sugar lactone lactonase YvrE